MHYGLYTYFENKETLLNEVIIASFKEATAFEFDLNKLLEMSPSQLIHFYFDYYFEILETKKELWQLIASLTFQVNAIPSVHQTISKIYQELLGQLEFIFTQMGYAEPTLEAHKLGAIVDGIGIQYLIFGENLPLEKIKQHLIKSYIQ